MFVLPNRQKQLWWLLLRSLLMWLLRLLLLWLRWQFFCGEHGWSSEMLWGRVENLPKCPRQLFLHLGVRPWGASSFLF